MSGSGVWGAVFVLALLLGSGCAAPAEPQPTSFATMSSVPQVKDGSIDRLKELAGSTDAMDQFELAILRALAA